MYQAIITPVQAILKHPNADRLEIAVVCNTHVVVGISNYKQDDLVIFFEPDGCLSQEYCEANGLYEKFEEVNGVKTRVGTGYLDPNGRIRALNLRSYKSNGLVMPLSSLNFLEFDRSVLKAGFSFSSLGGIEICKKYETPATKTARSQKNVQDTKLRNKTVFHEHVETQNFRRNVQAIPAGATITITEKLHGTSGRVGYVYSEISSYQRDLYKLRHIFSKTFTNKFVNAVNRFIGRKFLEAIRITKKGYAWQHGTRRVVLRADDRYADHNGRINSGYYKTDEFRWLIADRLLPMLRKGEEIYYEIVGDVGNGSSIMPPHSTAATSDKRFIKQWGDQITYNYRVPNGTAKAYVYRICVTNEDGYQWELPWEAVKVRCAELGVDHVPEHKTIYNYNPDNHINFGYKDLIGLVESLSLQSTFPNQFPEGVVVRIDHAGKTWFLKEKNWYFLTMEGFNKDKPDYVDTEEIQS